MIHADGDDAAEGIEISTARFIIDVLHGAFHKHQRILVVVAHMRRQERASLRPALRPRGARDKVWVGG
jgi:hypothetical protein